MGHVSRRKVCSNLFAMGALAFVLPGRAKAASTFKPIPLQFIAALADPAAKSGSGVVLVGASARTCWPPPSRSSRRRGKC